jgi:hypothetical protein
MATSLDLSRSYSSFSGVDIKVVIDGRIAGTMQAVSYAIQREKAPIYVMGRVDPLSFSRGKRGIAGTMISIMLDHREPWASSSQVILDKDEIIPDAFDSATNFTGGIDDFAGLSAVDPTLGVVPDVDRTVQTSIVDEWQAHAPNYVDQIAPFDISIIAVNEYGRAAMMRIYGCEILNEGSGFSIDDIVIENQMTYVCRTLLPWQRMGEWNMSSTGGVSDSFSPYVS